MVVAPRPEPGQEHLVKFEEDPRRLIPIEYQKQYTLFEAYDLIDKFSYYDKDHSGCIDAEELKLLLSDFDAEPATINKIMGAIDGNRNGQVEFDEFAALIAKVKRYKAEQLLPMQAMKGAVSSDAPSMFKLEGGAVLDRTLGPNFPVRYTANPRYKVETPPEPLEARAKSLKDRMGQKGTRVSYQTPTEFKLPGVEVQPPTHHVKHMVPGAGYGWSEHKWSGPWDLPQSYMTPANVEPNVITTSEDDRMYGTVKGEYPEHVARRRDPRLLERSQDM
ncbi:hypothetical protein TrST_g11815 [Triparma strigata]|uniref:EF-hand domain-containing protein n=1 Tax=Triparma strigata TaxID=1606541 RepID=A0A9W7AC61_9STRA|nr:hypothetical protein TrST_g11815 [Triparma strigata]